MGILSTVIIGGIIGAGTFFWSVDGVEKQSSERPDVHRQSSVGAMTPGLSIAGIPGSLLSAPTEIRQPVSRGMNRPEETRQRVATAPLPLHQDRLRGKDGNDPEQITSEPTEEETKQEELSRQLGQFVTDYWNNRINDYRQFIDRSLSSTDRAELNRLRVRWELLDGDGEGLFELQLGETRNISDDGENVNVASSMKWNRRDGGGIAMVAKLGDDLDSVSAELEALGMDLDSNAEEIERKIALAFADTRDGQANAVALNNVDRNIRVEVETNAQADGASSRTTTRIRKIEINRDGSEEQEVHTMNLQNLDMLDGASMGGLLKMAIAMDPSDRSGILRETWEIADRNRSDLDELKERVMADVRTFSDELQIRLRKYAVESDPEHAEQIAEALDNGEDLTEPIFNEVLGPLYDVIAEPMIMLYNGSDITKMLSSGITEPVAGIQLDGSSALAQSYPNPASTHATIDYRLNEASSSTTLRLYDIRGNEVLKENLGAIGEGEHSYDLEVSDLPSGTYLYHLTIETPEGSRVWSRSMEIQR